MAEKITKLKDEFSDIVFEAHKWLKDRHSDAELSQTWLNEILRGLRTEPLTFQSDVTNYTSLLKQLQTVWSFTNPTALERLVEKIASKPLIRRMSKYQEDFKNLRRLIAISQKPVLLEPLDYSKPCLILKITSDKHFVEINIFLTEVFSIYKRYLRIHKIQPGCVKVILQFDASIRAFIQACIDKNSAAVKHYAEMYIKDTLETELDTVPKESSDVRTQQEKQIKPTTTKKMKQSKSDTRLKMLAASHSPVEDVEKTLSYIGICGICKCVNAKEKTEPPARIKMYVQPTANNRQTAGKQAKVQPPRKFSEMYNRQRKQLQPTPTSQSIQRRQTK